jgi:pyruvate-ferredoxin/flavodoxin oxidoreductase
VRELLVCPLAAEGMRPRRRTMQRTTLTIDGNEAAARVAYKASEVIALYPITPASAMGELCDAWQRAGATNLLGRVPEVIEMQSEAGAAGALHGAVQSGALTTTFTASQGLLLMIPNLFKIAGELSPMVIHVAARSLATHALSIFGDHSDVMSVRSTGWALLASSSVQEAHDLALVAHAATLESRVPFLHFFDGFRTSHEVARIEALSDEDLRALIDLQHVRGVRERALTPDRPVLRGTAQNPDVFFQAREACNPFYDALPAIVRAKMQQLAERTGRRYDLFDYQGATDAERVIVLMGSGAGAVSEAVEVLRARGEKVGLLTVRLYRPFSGLDFLAALPSSAQAIAVLDRTKEPGALGEPLYQDVVTALSERRGSTASAPRVIGGRYGLASKEFTPAMAAAVFAELARPQPKQHFTIGIHDDVTHLSLAWDPQFDTERDDVLRAVFYGLGSDGTVGANKNSVKILGESTPLHAQGYFVYDSRKAGAVTVSHLRIGPRRIDASYLIGRANFVACHQFHFLERMDVLELAEPGATFLLNSPYGPEEVWEQLPIELQRDILEKAAEALRDRRAARGGEGGARRAHQHGDADLFLRLDRRRAARAGHPAHQGLHQEDLRCSRPVRPGSQLRRGRRRAAGAARRALARNVRGDLRRQPALAGPSTDFVQRVTAVMLAGHGDRLPVSALPVDGTFPTATALYEKRGIAREIPIWDESICIDCALCALVCPHSAIRLKTCEPSALAGAPQGFRSKAWSGKDRPGQQLIVQVAPDDCTGCGLCVAICPARSKEVAKHKALDMEPRPEHLELERASFAYFLDLPEVDRAAVDAGTVKGSQLLEPLFEFSGACAGCGETPYLKLLSQLYGDRLVIANATGCSSIYGGNLPTTPWTKDAHGRGPAWSNSLFEDNAEFGLGMRLAWDHRTAHARALLSELAPRVGAELAHQVLEADQESEAGLREGRARVAELERRLRALDSEAARELLAHSDALIEKSVWIVGGDGWAYDIGFGGLDHVLASDATSTCWCSIRPSTPTRADRLRRPRRALRSPSSRGREEAAQEGPRPVGRVVWQRVRGADRPGRQSQPDPQGVP